MVDVRVRPLEPGIFGVEIDAGRTTTVHRVRVPASFRDETRLGGFDEETVVRESMRFLLDREPAGAILAELTLSGIARHFPDHHDELRARLGA